MIEFSLFFPIIWDGFKNRLAKKMSYNTISSRFTPSKMDEFQKAILLYFSIYSSGGET